MNTHFHIIHEIFLDIAQHSNELLNKTEQPLQYLKSRHITNTSINKYMLGFIPKSTDRSFFYNYLHLEKRYDIYDLLRSGLIYINRRTRMIEDYFTGSRILFPIVFDNKIISFQTRTTYDKTNYKYICMAKPYNTFPVFNVDILKKNPKELYIAEGIMDFLTLSQMGYNAVAVLGTGRLNRYTAQHFKDYKGKIIFIFDTDANKAGEAGAIRSCKSLYSNGLNDFYSIQLPSYGSKSMDINSLCDIHGFWQAKSIINDIKPTKIPEDLYAKIRIVSRDTNIDLNIVSVLDKYCELIELANGNYKTFCPFPDHEDSVPSMYVYTDTNTCHCFGCGRHLSPIEFLSQYLNVPQNEILNKIEKEKV